MMSSSMENSKMSPRRKKYQWTANIVPWGTLQPIPKHPHNDKSSSQRRERAVRSIQEAFAVCLRELMEMQGFGSKATQTDAA